MTVDELCKQYNTLKKWADEAHDIVEQAKRFRGRSADYQLDLADDAVALKTMPIPSFLKEYKIAFNDDILAYGLNELKEQLECDLGIGASDRLVVGAYFRSDCEQCKAVYAGFAMSGKQSLVVMWDFNDHGWIGFLEGNLDEFLSPKYIGCSPKSPEEMQKMERVVHPVASSEFLSEILNPMNNWLYLF